MKKIFLFLTVIVLIWSCEEYEVSEREWPRVETSSLTIINSSTVSVKGRISQNDNNLEVLEYGVIFGSIYNLNLNVNMVSVIVEGSENSPFEGIIELPELNTFSTYAVRAYIMTSEYTILGDLITLKKSDLE